LARKKKDDDDIEKLVDNAFDKNAEQLIESMEATNQITEETERFLKADELWEAAATQMEARLLILSMSGMLAFAVTEHGGLYLDHLIEEEENNENNKG
jgi:molybdenum cofactor biosynthesis enzyme MoaA